MIGYIMVANAKNAGKFVIKIIFGINARANVTVAESPVKLSINGMVVVSVQNVEKFVMKIIFGIYATENVLSAESHVKSNTIGGMVINAPVAAK
jgi:hypothetical protein